MLYDTGDDLLKDLSKFKKKHSEKIRQEKWDKIEEQLEMAKKKHYRKWRMEFFILD